MTVAGLYDRQLLERARSDTFVGRLPHPHATVTAHSPLCGSRITVDLLLHDGRVSAYAYEMRACVIGRAVAATIANLILGMTPSVLSEGAMAMRALLTDETCLPRGIWTPLELFLPVASARSRHASALLPFDAVVRALAAAEAGAPAAVVTFHQPLSPSLSRHFT